MTDSAIGFFTGRYGFLSNFYPAWTKYEGLLYPTSEHAYQAAKSTDLKIRKKVRDLPSPSEAKRYGRNKTKVPLRAGWDKMKLDVMREVLRSKFRDPHMRKALLATVDRELIEGNDWGDKYWGKVGRTGANWLGRILMEVRAECLAEEQGGVA
jgi:ribA/ribD-fused uncharacterized protein